MMLNNATADLLMQFIWVLFLILGGIPVVLVLLFALVKTIALAIYTAKRDVEKSSRNPFNRQPPFTKG